MLKCLICRTAAHIEMIGYDTIYRFSLNLSHVIRKPAFCVCENKGADQLRSNCAADQRLCFGYIDSTIPLLPKSEISSLQQSSVTVQPGLYRIWSETPKTGFLATRLNSCYSVLYYKEQLLLFEPRCEKTGFLHMRKQRRRSASR